MAGFRHRLACLASVLAMTSGVTAGLVFTAAPPAAATHFRASQLTWTRTGPTTAEFRSVVSARQSFSLFGNPAVGATIEPTDIDYGDGTSESPPHQVVFVDLANDLLIAEATFSHTYSTAGPFTASSSGCCRLSGPLHQNNADGNIEAETIVDLAATAASPVSSISPIVDCPLNATCQFSVPAVDPDGQALRWRFATPDEAGGSFEQPGPPRAPNAATIDPATGLYSWNTTGAELNTNAGEDTFYSTQVIVENVVGGTVVSKTPIDFFIRLSSSTNQAPVFVAPTPADSTVIDATVGSPVSFDVSATDPDPGDVVTLTILNQPVGATFAPTAANPATGTFTWTPTAVGSTILTLTAQDQLGRGAVQRSVTIRVGAPGSITTTTSTSTTSTTAATSTTSTTLATTTTTTPPGAGPQGPGGPGGQQQQQQQQQQARTGLLARTGAYAIPMGLLAMAILMIGIILRYGSNGLPQPTLLGAAPAPAVFRPVRTRPPGTAATAGHLDAVAAEALAQIDGTAIPGASDDPAEGSSPVRKFLRDRKRPW